MKATELMIGDFIMDTSNHIHRISCIEVLDVFCDNGFYYGLDDIKPIPLTEDILKANKISDEGDPILDDIKMPVPYRFKIIDKYGVSIGKKCYFHYVHELQHALRLCELNDLADNFKIE